MGKGIPLGDGSSGSTRASRPNSLARGVLSVTMLGVVVAGLATLTTGSSSGAQLAVPNVYVGNAGGTPDVTSYPASASGNTSPFNTFTQSGAVGSLAFDGSGNLWVGAGSGASGTISKYSASQLHSSGNATPAVSITTTFNGVNSGAAFDAAGNLWIASLGGSVQEFTASQLTSSGAKTAAVTLTLPSPNGLAFDAQGNLWVTSYSNDTVSKYTAAQLASTGSPTPPVVVGGSGLNGPARLAFDGSGDLWIGNYGNNTVVEYAASKLASSGSPAPTVTLSASSNSLSEPNGVAFDPSGDLWVSNEQTSTLIEFTPGQLTASGSPTPAKTISGSSTGLNTPYVVAVGPACPSNADAYSSAVLANSPIAYYRLDETSGPTACDSSTSHNNGTYTSSGVSYGVPGALPGSPDTAVAADGTAQGIATSGANSGITGNHSFTLEGWFRKTSTVQNQVLVSFGTASNGGAAGLGVWAVTNVYTQPDATCLQHGSAVILDSYNGSDCWDTTPAGVNVYDGHWHYVAVTYSTSTGKMTAYVDGQSLGSQAAPQTMNFQASPIRIGYWVDQEINQWLIGGADEVAVYASALSAAQVQAHYAAASQTTTTTSGTTSSTSTSTTSTTTSTTHTTTSTTRTSTSTSTTTSSSKHQSAAQVICNLDVQTGIDTCGVTIGDTGSSPTNPTGAVTFSIVPGSDTEGTFPVGTTCSLQATPGSGNVSFCSVRFKPGGTDSFPHIHVAYAGDPTHTPSSADTALVGACAPLPPDSPVNTVDGTKIAADTGAARDAAASPPRDQFGNPLDPCDSKNRLPVYYLDVPPPDNNSTVTPTPTKPGQPECRNSIDGIHYIVPPSQFQACPGSGTSPAADSSGPAAHVAKAGTSRNRGMAVRYRLRGPALVTFWVAKVLRSSHGKHHAHLALMRGTYTVISVKGLNTFRFYGWIGGRKLAPGRYLLIARPFLQGVVGYPRTLPFRVIH